MTPIRKRVRTSLRAAAVVVALLAVALALAVAFREAVVGAVARRLLAARGFPDAEVEVLEVGRARAVLAPLRLGPGLGAERVRLDYDLGLLPGSPLTAVRAEGVLVDLGASGPARGGGAEEAGVALPVALPKIEVTDAVVRMPTAYGPLSLRGDAEIAPGMEKASSRGTVTAPGGSARFFVDLAAEGGRLSGAVRLDSVVTDRPGLVVEGAAGRIDVAGDTNAPRGTMRFEADRIGYAGVEARDLLASLPLALDRGDGGTALRLVEPGRLEARSGVSAPGVEIAGLVASIPPEASVAPTDHGFGLTAALGIEPFEARLAGEGDPVRVTVGPLALRVKAGGTAAPLTAEVTTEGARLRVAKPPLEVSGLVAGIALGETVTVEIGTAEIADRADPPRVAPLTFRGRAERRDGVVALRGEVSAARGAARARFSGEHDPGRKRGSLRYDLPSVAFAPDGLQPGDLAPPLARLGRVSGPVEAGGWIRWDADGAKASLALRTKGISFTVGGVHVDSLAGSVDLPSVVPLESAPGQELRARRIRFGIDLEEALLRYSLAQGSGGAPKLDVERGEGRFAGGRLLLEDESFDPDAAANEIRVRAVAVDLDRLADALGASGFEATGAVSGELPLRLSADGIAVAGGRLDATGPGVVKVAVETARRVLPAGEESLDLLLRALENFHYDDLSIRLEKEAEGASAVRLHLDGRNPDLLSGRPFRIRVNVSANLDELLGPVVEAVRLTDRTLQEILRGLR